ncbi:hypothetical protein LXL04_001267 [Taraxacum kok-saghyz]
MENLEACCNNGSVQNNRQSSDSNSPQPYTYSDDIDSAVSSPYASAPSSPGRGPPYSYRGGFFYSAPTSPTHRLSSSCYSNMDSVSSIPLEGSGGSFEFEFTVRKEASGPAPSGSMTSADELFLNGQIRPMKLSSHLQRPQDPAPLIDVLDKDNEDGGGEEDKVRGGRDCKCRDRSKPVKRRARSMSPLRSNSAFQWLEDFQDGRESTEINEIKEELEAEEKQRGDEDNEIPSSSASSRSSSVGRSSKRWVFLKELLYRSKSEGRNRTSSNKNHKLWSTLSFSPSGNKEKKSTKTVDGNSSAEVPPPKTTAKKAVNGVGMNRKRSLGRSAHEVHYTTNRAQAEEMRKKTYLPYKQGLLGCIGFSSKSYGAMNGFARAFNPVPSRKKTSLLDYGNMKMSFQHPDIGYVMDLLDDEDICILKSVILETNKVVHIFLAVVEVARVEPEVDEENYEGGGIASGGNQVMVLGNTENYAKVDEETFDKEIEPITEVEEDHLYEYGRAIDTKLES